MPPPAARKCLGHLGVWKADLTAWLPWACCTHGHVSAGIGVETARALASAGADVVITSRDVAVGERVAAGIQAAGAKGKVTVKQLDLADVVNVEAFAEDVAASLGRIDYLILNAGVMATPLWRTKDGFEMQTGTNHLGHFQLLQQLLPKLRGQVGCGDG